MASSYTKITSCLVRNCVSLNVFPVGVNLWSGVD